MIARREGEAPAEPGWSSSTGASPSQDGPNPDRGFTRPVAHFMSTKPPSFTGRTRKRSTSWVVRLTDLLARALITVGGIGTIGAVTLVCVFLVWVVVPLFRGAEITPPRQLTPEAAGQSVREGLDEYR